MGLTNPARDRAAMPQEARGLSRSRPSRSTACRECGQASRYPSNIPPGKKRLCRIKGKFTIVVQSPVRQRDQDRDLESMRKSDFPLSEKLLQERRGRLAAERQLQEKQRDLTDLSQKLTQYVQTHAVPPLATSVGPMTEAQETRRKLLVALEAMRDGFALYDPLLHLVVANHAYLDLFDGAVFPPGTPYAAMIAQLAASGTIDRQGVSASDWQRQMTNRI
ncbi:MAG TPA: hypothetical protein VGC31_11140, partial [Paenirhodobacter sp.]